MDKKCFRDLIIKPDGINELDPCIYEDIEMYANVTVIISRCKKCGHIEILRISIITTNQSIAVKTSISFTTIFLRIQDNI